MVASAPPCTPRGASLKPKTLAAILDQAGVTVDDLRDAL